MLKKRWKIEEKKHHVAAWRASGLTRQQYAELHDIPFTAMREWPQEVAKAERRKNESGLLPVHISTDLPAENLPQVVNDPIMLFLPGGIRMSCHSTQLSDVFRALKHANA
ncbi:IS66 family insertion sequence element accessory protein TnpB [Salmonella enterica]|nr:IS66 family insertion sequence element accessory protein TnpB [Salmonella enterica subsp. enterica serovar Edinburgh]EBH8901662.1 IS66 family insertion sequence hypothetical protein [Salmonella enterica subsp. enterica serovar 6,7:b:-]EBH8905951.1 IS66 family insertion sequence hypothetical protein [Salmonella enterica subsp. enterica serovar Santiago]EHG2692349.1 IS66 family insertion sequence element accessory protein TnpB [Salmonella enterica]EBH8942273.1 IS66 family insertion sequence hy